MDTVSLYLNKKIDQFVMCRLKFVNAVFNDIGLGVYGV